MTSDHFDIGSVWKSLVASCVCVYVAKIRKRVFNVFVSSAKHIHLQLQKCLSLDQHKMRSLLAINAFVCRVIRR